MGPNATDNLLNHVRKLASVECNKQAPDGELLRRYAAQRDDQAFAAVVRRHGAMVLRVCQRILGKAEDAEDAYQATFLVLMRKAGSVRWKPSVANWLYGVAYRISLNERKRVARRQRCEGRAPAALARDPLAEITLRDAQAIVDAELAKMSDRYRAPLVHCYLEGATRDEAALQLGWSLATLKRRLDEARSILQARLRRRGLELPTAILTTMVGASSASAVTSPAMVATLLGNLAASGQATGGAARAGVLAEGFLRVMFLSQLKSIAILALAGMVVVGAAAWVALRSSSAPNLAEAAIVRKDAGPPPQVATQPAQPDHLQQARALIAALPQDEQQLLLLVRIAKAHALKGDADSARSVFRDAKELAIRVTGDRRRGRFEVVVAIAQAEAGLVQDAFATADELGDPCYVASTFGAIAVCQVQQGDLVGAGKTLDALAALRHVPYELPPGRVRSLPACVDDSLYGAHWNMAREHVAAKNFSAASRAIRSIPRATDRIVPLTELAGALARNGKLALAKETVREACALFAQAAEAGQLVDASRNAIDPWVRGNIAAAQFRVGDEAGVLQSAACLEGGAKDLLLMAIAQQGIRNGDFDKVGQVAATIANRFDRQGVIKAMALAKAQRGDARTALRDLETAVEEADRGEALAELALLESGRGDRTGALETLRKAQDWIAHARRKDSKLDPRLAGYAEVAGALARLGAEADALAWAEGEVDVIARSWILIGIAEGQARRGRLELKTAAGVADAGRR